jgi:prepilin-type N-terminal cleavage/methylation domain-containing protein
VGLAESAGRCAPRRAKSRRDACATESRRGFTLIETLVAVGALAFVATGIAVIFEATGKTVTTGKRVSAFNTAAAAIEHQLRADLASMTRDGFLVIRNEYADRTPDGHVDPTVVNNNNDFVSLYDGDPKPRVRRTDELMFFAKGHFKSARPPVVPGYEARAEAARIYYGHGQRWRVVNDPKYTRPTLDQYPQTADNPAEMQLGNDASDNPNRYAADWTLLRHVTLLCPPQAAERPVPATMPNGLNQSNFPDSDLQVALRPAAPNIFRGLAFPFGAVGNEVHPAGAGNPQFASNLLDIATTDLPQIRSVVESADVDPASADNTFYAQHVKGIFQPGDPTALKLQQEWMDDALPAFSDNPTANQRYRVRYEPAPPDFAGVLADTTGSLTDREVRRADQMMLSAANFLPHCTEFIVEWSFGDVYSQSQTRPNGTRDRYFHGPEYAGETIWHGLRRQAIQSGVTHDQAVPFDPRDSWNYGATTVPLNDGVNTTTHEVSQELIHGTAATIDDTMPLISYFGYLDPTFNPDLNSNGKLGDPGDASVATIPWKWPKMIRVTVSLADPNDPSYERTFQFVFDVPQDAAQ